MSNLSQRQERVLLFIQREIARTGHAPTLEAIAEHCGVTSKGRIHTVVSGLVDLGYLAKDSNKARGLRVLRPIADDRFEAAAKAVCAALGHTSPADVRTAHAALVSTLIERSAA